MREKKVFKRLLLKIACSANLLYRDFHADLLTQKLLTNIMEFRTMEQLKTAIEEYIEYCNTDETRLPSSIDFQREDQVQL